MNIKVQTRCVAVLAALLVGGCSENEQGAAGAETGKESRPAAAEASAAAAKAAAGTQQAAQAKIIDDAVLIQCGTNKWTMGEAKKLAALRAKIIKMATPNGENLNLDAAFAARIIAGAPMAFPRECAIADFARENNITADEKLLGEMRKRALSAAKQGFSTWKSFMSRLDAHEREMMEERVRVEGLTEAVRLWHAANKPAPMTDEEIAQYRKIQRDYNAMAAATNDLTFAQATNVWNEIKAGLEFEEAVERYSTDEQSDSDGEWGDFMLDYFNDNPILRNMLATMEPGTCTPPVEGDNGLMIVRLDEVRDEGDGRPIYVLSRVFFHLPEFYPELDDEAFAKELREARQNRLFNEFVEDLAKKQEVSFPCGEEVFENARRTAAQPALM